MNTINKVLTTLAFAGTLFAGPVEEGTAISKKADQLVRGFKDLKYESTMELIGTKGDIVERKMVTLTLERKDSKDYSIIQFLNPADVRGTGLLTHQDPSGDDKQWLYLPELRRVKKISSSNKSGSFMGSEFSYEDISGNTFGKWNYKKLADAKINGEDCYVIERIPNYKNSGYSKTKSFIRKSDNLPIRTEFFDRKKSLLKVQTISGYVKVGEAWLWTEILVENLQTGKKSKLTVGKRTTGHKLKDGDFNKRKLKRPIKI
jgi:outer membrane lipoprotein-sorting protein